VINSSLSRGRRFCPNVERSITNSSASSRTVGRAAPRECSSDKIPYWLDLSLTGANTVSYMSDNRRAAFFAAEALHRLILGTCPSSSGIFFLSVIFSGVGRNIVSPYEGISLYTILCWYATIAAKTRSFHVGVFYFWKCGRKFLRYRSLKCIYT